MRFKNMIHFKTESKIKCGNLGLINVLWNLPMHHVLLTSLGLLMPSMKWDYTGVILFANFFTLSEIPTWICASLSHYLAWRLVTNDIKDMTAVASYRIRSFNRRVSPHLRLFFITCLRHLEVRGVIILTLAREKASTRYCFCWLSPYVVLQRHNVFVIVHRTTAGCVTVSCSLVSGF